MRLPCLLSIVAVLSAASVRAEAAATGVMSGECEPNNEPGLAGIADAVDGAWQLSHPDPAAALRALQEQQTISALKAQAKRDAPPCVPAADARREVSEEVELSRIENDVKAAADQQCKETVCLSNLAHFVTGYNKNPYTFGGCDNWSRLAAETIGSRAYFDMRREQRCHLVVRCHWVVVLENSRTGKVHVIDAWAYAGSWAPGAATAWDVTGDYDAFKSKYGGVADKESFGKPRCP